MFISSCSTHRERPNTTETTSWIIIPSHNTHFISVISRSCRLPSKPSSSCRILCESWILHSHYPPWELCFGVADFPLNPVAPPATWVFYVGVVDCPLESHVAATGEICVGLTDFPLNLPIPLGELCQGEYTGASHH